MTWELLSPIPARISLIAFTICQPLLLNKFLSYLGSSETANSTNYGVGLIVAYGVVYLGMAISTGFYYHALFRFISMVRGSLVSAIYRKTTDINLTAFNDSAAVTLMSTDVERVVEGLRFTHEFWADLLQVGIATYLLKREVGLACISPLIISAFCAVIAVSLGIASGKRQYVIFLVKYSPPQGQSEI